NTGDISLVSPQGANSLTVSTPGTATIALSSPNADTMANLTVNGTSVNSQINVNGNVGTSGNLRTLTLNAPTINFSGAPAVQAGTSITITDTQSQSPNGNPALTVTGKANFTTPSATIS